VTIENRAVGDVHPFTVFNRQAGRGLPYVGDMQARKRTIGTVANEKAVSGLKAVAVIVARIPVEVVGADDDIRTIFNQKVVSVTHPERVSGEDNAPTVF